MQPKRRWFQFSLRTLVVVMLLVSLVLGYWGYARRRAQRQWEAVRAIREAGGTVRDDNMYWPHPNNSPTWQRRLGIECPEAFHVDVTLSEGSGKEIMPHLRQLRELKDIRLDGDWLDDEGMKALFDSSNLTNLEIASDQITDTGILSIAGNKKLQTLSLSGKQLTDRGMAVVAQLPEVVFLELKLANATGEGLMHLRNHPQLKSLTISGAMASDAGFEHLSACANLEELKALEIEGPNTLTSRGVSALACLRLKHLWLKTSPLSKDAVAGLPNLTKLRCLGSSDWKMTAEVLKNLVLLPNLELLKVDMSDLGDEDMEVLALFVKLVHIDLSNSSVTDAGLIKLAVMKKLWSIDIEGTKVTAEGVKEFNRLAPNVKVYGSPEN